MTDMYMPRTARALVEALIDDIGPNIETFRAVVAELARSAQRSGDALDEQQRGDGREWRAIARTLARVR